MTVNSTNYSLVTTLFTAENVIHIKNVITILIIVAIVLGAFARLGENAPRVAR